MPKTNKKVEKFLIAMRIKENVFSVPAYKKDKCCECGAEVGMSKESYKAMRLHKNIKMLCFDCFKKKKDDNPVIKRPTTGQIKEMRQVHPDYNEMDIRYALDKLKGMVKK